MKGRRGSEQTLPQNQPRHPELVSGSIPRFAPKRGAGRKPCRRALGADFGMCDTLDAEKSSTRRNCAGFWGVNPNVTQERIQRAYRNFGYKDGWRFMSCPEGNFANPSTLLVTLNPGGRAGIDVENPTWSQERGSSYLHEAWGNRPIGGESLQIQIQRMFEMLGQPIDNVASAYFIPFRSARWNDLEHKEEALAFSESLWADLCAGLNPKFVICIGSTVGTYMSRLLAVRNLQKRPTGWGKVTLQTGFTEKGGTFVSLPHLGTFKLFSNSNCTPYLRNAFGLEAANNA